MYINFKGSSGIETVENLQGMTRLQRVNLLKEYMLVSPKYYMSSRASKAYYKDDKKHDFNNKSKHKITQVLENCTSNKSYYDFSLIKDVLNILDNKLSNIAFLGMRYGKITAHILLGKKLLTVCYSEQNELFIVALGDDKVYKIDNCSYNWQFDKIKKHLTEG